MVSLLRLFIDLCLFRRRAEDVPISETLLLATAALAVITSAINAVPTAEFIWGLLMSGGEVLLFALLISLLLRFRSLSERTTQTLTAMFGATALLQLLTLPFLGWHEHLLAAPQDAVIAPPPEVLIVLAISFWIIAVTVSILRQAMECGTGLALSLIIAIKLVTLVVLTTFNGSPSG